MEGTDQVFVNVHKRSIILELSTVIGCRKDRDQFSFPEKLISLLDNLMSSTDQVDIKLG